jgi:hypothetical protein
MDIVILLEKYSPSVRSFLEFQRELAIQGCFFLYLLRVFDYPFKQS